MKLIKRQIELSNRSIFGRFGHNVDYHSRRTTFVFGVLFILLGTLFLVDNLALNLFSNFLMIVGLLFLYIRCDCAGPVVYVSNSTRKNYGELWKFGFLPLLLIGFSSIFIGMGMASILMGAWYLYLSFSGKCKFFSYKDEYQKIRSASTRKCSMEELQEIVELAVELGDYDQAEKVSKLLVEKAEGS